MKDFKKFRGFVIYIFFFFKEILLLKLVVQKISLIKMAKVTLIRIIITKKPKLCET